MNNQNHTAGRTCPLRYRYGAGALARVPEKPVETLYVVGGLYGNLPALDAVEAMVSAEAGTVTVCFNGDFNWFNVDDDSFAEINRRVLEHGAIQGNVEAELGARDDDAGNAAGCGCAYPDAVDDAVVERSNRIHARLKATASRHPEILDRLGQLAMFARYRVGDVRVGVVHGDADSLAGWRFDVAALDAPDNRSWLADAFSRAEVEVFASTHTCLPALRSFAGPSDRSRVVINNGAAGMPNFAGEQAGLLTRISVLPSPHVPVHGIRQENLHIDALAIRFDAARWDAAFLNNWPAGSEAWVSYFDRIRSGPTFSRAQAVLSRRDETVAA
jgi:hypothetical protein